ncbi:unnamed protein product, partial [Owenia fusiformis]
RFSLSNSHDNIFEPKMLTLNSICAVLIALIVVKVDASYVLDDQDGLGRQYDGIGGLSGGGATSKLLMNYPDKQRNEILDYLFKPNFGASLQILKVEIGGDSQSTDGTESSHMHESWDENYKRGYEWQLMLEAKKRNPKIKLYGLPWAFPGWVGKGTRSPYKFPELSANYITKWLVGAKVHYNLTIDYVGIWNERPYDITYIKTLRKMLDSNLLESVQIVAADGGWGISSDIMKDPVLRDAITYIGTHYPGTVSSNEAKMTGKQLWSSEDYSTFNDEVGGGCWARILNQNYVNGYMTATISWNLIASYYESLPFGRDGLMTAEEPWSGHYVVDTPIWVSAHTTQFTNIGWKYLKHGMGVGKLAKGGSMVTLTSPDMKELTIVIETMSHNHSKCIRPALPAYDVAPQNVTINLKGSFGSITELNMWTSKIGFNGQASAMFKNMGKIKAGSSFTVALDVDEIVTLTTVNTGMKGTYPDSPASKPFPTQYKDDFQSYPEFSEPFNIAPQIGVFEIRMSQDPAHAKYLKQVVLQQPCDWCSQDNNKPIAIIGDAWSDLTAQIDFSIPKVNGSSGPFIALRVDRGGCGAYQAQGLFFWVTTTTNMYYLSSDLAHEKLLAHGSATVNTDAWYTLKLTAKGNMVTGELSGKQLFSIDVSKAGAPSKGFAAFGTMDFGYGEFDNFMIN